MRERTPLTREILQQLPNLKLIASTGPRNASINSQTATDLGIAVTATGYDSTPTIEFTWSLILASIRGIDREAASLKAGGWQTSLGSNLRGRSLGVVGLGNIGREVARIGLAFGMKVIAWSENLTEEKASAASAFRKLENVLATPHIGYVTEDLYRTFYGDAAANIAKWIEANATSV